MTTKHTQGPWRIGKFHGAVVADTPVNAGLDNEHVEAYGGHLIAESIAVCNRPLIAAAPELLDAGMGAAGSLSAAMDIMTRLGYGKTAHAMQVYHDALVAAIAKATGEQQ